MDKEKLVAAFTEWERRWREEPERYQSELERLKQSVVSTGEQQAAYLLQLLSEL